MVDTSRTLFENQFQARTYISVPWGEIETVDVIPNTLISDLPIFFAPGFRETPELQRECIYRLFTAGYRVLTCFHPVVIPTEQSQEFPPIELQKAKNILAVIDAKNISKLDLLTHSEGAINSSIASLLRPDLMRSLILLTPAGLNGNNDNLIYLSWRFFVFLLRTNSLSVVKNATRISRKKTSIMSNILCGFAEGNTMITSNIAPYLRDIRKKGVKVIILPGENDTVFSKEKIIQELGKDSYDMFVLKKGGHEVYTKPEISMNTVIEVLQKIN